jgi:LPXTG-motif cell wall-anchored protein
MPSSFLRRLAATTGAALVAFGAFGAAPAQAEDDTFPWDLTIPVVNVTGAVGDVVPITLTVRNLGPGVVEPGRVRTAFIQKPAGTEFAGDVSADCDGTVQPENRYYCQPKQGLAVGAEVTWTFHLKLVDAHPGDDGLMFFADGGGEDRDSANDGGRFTVTIKAPQSNPTTGTPPATPTRTATATASPSAGPALPVTGDRTALYAGLGAILVAAGAALFVIARRRRVVIVTPDE